jgi:ATP-dependent DNA helicase RecQ
VAADWEEGNAGSSEGILSSSGSDGEYADDFIEMEQEKGAIYEFMSVSVSKLFLFYKDEGWDAVVRELERHTRRGRTSLGRNRGIDYTARLDESGKELYERLRRLRSGIAVQKQLPSYFIFTNRTLYEMCCHQPGTMEELRALYGVGEKNSRDYGQVFLEAITGFKDGIMK